MFAAALAFYATFTAVAAAQSSSLSASPSRTPTPTQLPTSYTPIDAIIPYVTGSQGAIAATVVGADPTFTTYNLVCTELLTDVSAQVADTATSCPLMQYADVPQMTVTANANSFYMSIQVPSGISTITTSAHNNPTATSAVIIESLTIIDCTFTGTTEGLCEYTTANAREGGLFTFTMSSSSVDSTVMMSSSFRIDSGVEKLSAASTAPPPSSTPPSVTATTPAPTTGAAAVVGKDFTTGPLYTLLMSALSFFMFL